MTLAESVSLELVITGEAVPGVNPGWRGTIVASAPFAALLLVRVGDSLSWGKPEVISDTNVPISLYLHPLNWAGTSVQFLFSVGWRGIEDVCVPIAPENLRPPIPTGFRFGPYHAHTFCTVASTPTATFELFFLPRSSVSKGRTGVWRPHKRLRGGFPPHIELALCGGRKGRYPRPAAV